MTNISKKEWNGNGVYSLSKKDLGKYLNTWFRNEFHESKSLTKKMIYTDSMITLKKCDKETTSNLYKIKYNPLYISIMCLTCLLYTSDAADE